MTIAHITGGLGNQMFQYAAARAFAADKGSKLFLDLNAFTSYRLHQGFELHRVFNVPTPEVDDEHLREVLGWQASHHLRSLFVRYPFRFMARRSIVIEPHFHYWPGIHQAPANIYLYGYWQSEKYFAHHASLIRQDFTFQRELEGKNLQLATEMAEHTSVSLHVRRGDYVSAGKASSILGTCSLDYYRKAIDHLKKVVKNPYFYVFSDDMPWVKMNLNVDAKTVYVDHNVGEESYRDMQLMSLCQHHIIANSSFSWWGAWLNPSADKIVVAPERWFASNLCADDLVPSSWERF